jgi:hypothetical protein
MRKEEIHAKIQRILQIVLEIQSYDKIDITFTLSSESKTFTVQAFAGKKRHDIKDFIVNTSIDLLTEELLRILSNSRRG